VKILHTADVHLRKVNDERWTTLLNLITIAKKEEIDLFIISGDLFDKETDSVRLRPRVRDIFSDNGFQVVILPGNHDQTAYKGGMYFGSDVHVVSDQSTPVEKEDLCIWGIPFGRMSGGSLLQQIRSIAGRLSSKKRNILLFHGELLDTFYSRKDFGDEGRERYMPAWLSYFSSLNVDYVLAGHFHSSFDVRVLEGGGYFVYPGSPVSLSRKETGRRKVNIFEIGGPPGEYLLDSFHFEEVEVTLDPFQQEGPVHYISEKLKDLHPSARIFLTVKGFLKEGMSEKALAETIEELIGIRCEEKHLEFYDVQSILRDDLFKRFMNKLEQKVEDPLKKKDLYDMVIRAFMEAGI
jgi:DNA repair exonuclease SbcCD nuclease subunit